MLLYNSLTRKIETFSPYEEGKVRIYSCGPTVYDHIHIGNLSSFIYADTLRRALEIDGNKVTHLMNFTDVEDKIIARSRETYPKDDAMTALKKLTEHYSDVFLTDIKQIGNDIGGYTFVKATASIKAITTLIEDLFNAGFAYITDDGVYFSIEAYKNAGKTYGQLVKVSVSKAHSRISNDEYDKDQAQDFALWKIQKDGEPAWPFSLDGQELDGRPGWHIECSAMSAAGLKVPFDIHTGGIDLMFPHHENEIAQSTAIGDSDTLAKFFFHNEHIIIDGKKMSKSLKNFYTLEDIVSKGIEPLAFRLLVLQSHYRSQTNFTWESLEAAQNRLKSLQAMADLYFQLPKTQQVEDNFFDEMQKGIKTAALNDLALPHALSLLSEIQTILEQDKVHVSAKSLHKFLVWLDHLLGLQLSSRKDITKEQKELIRDREQAREDKDWAKADQLRDKLLKDKIALNDRAGESIWYRL